MEEAHLVIKHVEGLHARPATIFVQLASRYKSDIKVFCRGRKANAKSIINVLTLGANQNSEIILQAEGEDEKIAVKILKELIENDFIDKNTK